MLDASSRVLVQGMTGDAGSWSTRDLLAYRTTVVGGVVPGRGGSTHAGLPVFDSVTQAVAATGADASIVYVPPAAAAEAVTEAIDAGIRLVVYPGDGLPTHDALRLRRRARQRGAIMIGPNGPGLISPGRSKLGFMPSFCFRPGSLGVISKSGSLSYEVCYRLSQAGYGQTTVIGVGGDPIKGLTIGEALELFDKDLETSAVLVLGEIGGVEEYQAASYAQRHGAKRVAALLVGRTAPRGRKLGHAGALITGERETYDAKFLALSQAGVHMARTITEVVRCAADLLVGEDSIGNPVALT